MEKEKRGPRLEGSFKQSRDGKIRGQTEEFCESVKFGRVWGEAGDESGGVGRNATELCIARI